MHTASINRLDKAVRAALNQLWYQLVAQVAPLNRPPGSLAKPACLTCVLVEQACLTGEYWSNRVPSGSNHPVQSVLTGQTGIFDQHTRQTLLFGR
jgi:hypothetical protein